MPCELSIKLIAPDTARADILFTPRRTYYRFVTADTLDSGEIAPLLSYRPTIDEMVSLLHPRDKEQPIGDDLIFQVGTDDIQLPPTSEQALRRLIRRLVDIAPEFAFLNGFL